jgi:hypothetical protein
MFIVYYKNDTNNGKVIRPTPFISISYSLDRNKDTLFGGRYNITLNGTLLHNAGSPQNTADPDSILSQGPNYETNPSGEFTRTPKQIINFSDRAYSMLLKQQALRALFAHDGQKMEMLSIRNDESIIVFYPEVESISFEEGTYTDICRYTVNLTTNALFDKNDNLLDVAGSGFYDSTSENKNYHIENYSDEWSLEPDESFGITQNSIRPPSSNPFMNVVPRIYRITRNISATGKTMYFPKNDNREEAWEQAKKFVKFNILKENISVAPSSQITSFPSYSDTLGSGLLNISLPVSGYNHVRSETINKTDGTYSLSDSWIISPDNAVESYNISLSSDNNSPLVSVSINGNVKGLSNKTADNFVNNIKFNNAMTKLRTISNNFSFDINSTIYKRAKSTTPIILNMIPNSVNITQNESTGEMTYNVNYNNRPTNFIRNVSSENIVITDTYPGDVYTVTPVINRNNGPLLQYIGGRTEYRRDLNIELNVNRSNMGYYKMNSKGSYIYKKPSINPIISSDLQTIINTCSPAGEPDIRKYFLNPPSESWDPKTGKYSLQISWTYELIR